MTWIGSSRSSLSSRTALMARMAASPRLTMARRVKGARVGVTRPVCDGRHLAFARQVATEPPGQVGRTRHCRGRPPSTSGIQGSGAAVVVAVTLERHELQMHGHRVSYRTAGSGPALLLLHGITNSSETWERAASLLCRPLHADRAGPARPRGVGHAARGLLARRARQRRPRRRERARPRARDGRRPLARRRDRDAVRLPVPRAHRAPRAGLQRRPRPRGPPAAARRVAARRRLRPPRADLPARSSTSAAGSAVCSAASACSRAATSACSRADSRRSTTPARARRSCTRCAP